jgi:hypothetical protein
MIDKKKQIKLKKTGVLLPPEAYKDRYQHQQDRMARFTVSTEMMPIFLALQDILAELKKLNERKT